MRCCWRCPNSLEGEEVEKVEEEVGEDEASSTKTAAEDRLQPVSI